MQSLLITVYFSFYFSFIRLLSRCQPLIHLSGHQRASGGAQCLPREHLSWVLLIIWLQSFFWENHTVRKRNGSNNPAFIFQQWISDNVVLMTGFSPLWVAGNYQCGKFKLALVVCWRARMALQPANIMEELILLLYPPLFPTGSPQYSRVIYETGLMSGTAKAFFPTFYLFFFK